MNGNGQPTLADTLAGLEAAIQSASIQELPRLRGELKRLDAMAELQMLTGSRPPEQLETTGKPPMTAKQVAERLNVPTSFVYEAARQGKLKPVKLGKKYKRFTVGAVEEYLATGGA